MAFISSKIPLLIPGSPRTLGGRYKPIFVLDATLVSRIELGPLGSNTLDFDQFSSLGRRAKKSRDIKSGLSYRRGCVTVLLNSMWINFKVGIYLFTSVFV